MGILWLSRHNPLPAQVRELQRVFGDGVVIDIDSRPFASAEDIVERVRAGGYNEVVLVAPLSMVAKVVEMGIKPLFADMERIDFAENTDTDVDLGCGRAYRFKEFKRIVGIKVEMESLKGEL